LRQVDLKSIARLLPGTEPWTILAGSGSLRRLRAQAAALVRERNRGDTIGVAPAAHALTFSVTSLNPRRLARWLLWGSLAIHAPIALVATFDSKLPNPDFDNYYDIATRSGRPYVDFPVEFPVGTVQAFRTLGPIAGDRERFGVSLVIVNVVADLAIAGALAWGWGIGVAACYAFIVTPIVDLFFLRTDLWSTALATIGVAAWQRERRVFAAIGFVAGAAFKLWPLAFLPLLLVPSTARRRVAPLAAAIATGVVILGAWLWVAGPRGLYQVLTFRGAQGWEIESTVGALWMLVDQSTMRIESGAWRIGTTSGPISVLLFVLGAIPCLWMIWRGARTSHLGAGWAGGISSLLVLSALLSPQFACWLAPATGVAWVEGDRRIAVLTALAVFLTNLVWKSFNPLVHGAMGPLVMLLARNLLLAVIAVDVARLVARAPLRPSRIETAV
jgi:hypothetical protein